MKPGMLHQLRFVVEVLVELGFTRRAGRKHVVDGRRRDALHMHQLGGGKDNPVAGRCAA
jgi:hypothetical protein